MKFPTQREFLSWWKEHPDVGIPGSSQFCPIACYLREVQGLSSPLVGRALWRYSDGGPFVVPAWARAWIKEFDKQEGLE